MKKFLLSVFFILNSIFIFAVPNDAMDIDSLENITTQQELVELIKRNPKILKKEIGELEENILLFSIRKNKSEEIINFLLDNKVNPLDKNNLKQDSLIYVCKYSNKNPIVASIIVKKYGNKKTLTNALKKQDKEKKCALDYILESSNTTVYNIIEKVVETNIIEKYRPQTSEPNNIRIKPSESFDILDTSKEQINEEQKIIETQENKQEESSQESTLQEENPQQENDIAQNLDNNKIEEKKDYVTQDTTTIGEYKKLFLYDYEPTQKEKIPEEITNNSIEFANIPNPNTRDNKGRTPLMIAVKAGNDWETKSLLKSGADINLQDYEGWTALMYSIRYQNNIDLVNLLLKNGADTSITNKYGTNALQIAATYSNNPEILKEILNEYTAGSNEIFKSFILTLTSNSGSYATQLAKINLYIERNVSMNRFYEGKTPLMYASEFSSSTEILKILIDNGAITTMRDANGKTAFDYASLNNKLSHDNIYWSLNSH